MRIFKNILIGLTYVCGAFRIVCFFKACSTGGTCSGDILSAVDLDLPKYKVISEDNNLDRGAGHMDWFMYDVKFSTEDSTSLIKQLKEKGWGKGPVAYYKSVEIDEDLSYHAEVIPAQGTAPLGVNVDALYGIIYIFPAWLAFVFVAVLWLTYWFVVRLITAFRKDEAEDNT